MGARRQVDARREEILNATVVEVGSRGFARTRVADVARSLGVSTALVFYHFSSKERLLAEALQHAAQRDLDRLERSVARGRDAADQVRRVLRLYAPTGHAPGWTIWVDAWAEGLQVPELREVSRRLDVRWKDTLAAAIRAGNTAQMFSCPDPDGAAWRLSALLDGLAVQVVVHHSLTRRQLDVWVREAAARELGIEVGALGG